MDFYVPVKRASAKMFQVKTYIFLKSNILLYMTGYDISDICVVTVSNYCRKWDFTCRTQTSGEIHAV